MGTINQILAVSQNISLDSVDESVFQLEEYHPLELIDLDGKWVGQIDDAFPVELIINIKKEYADISINGQRVGFGFVSWIKPTIIEGHPRFQFHRDVYNERGDRIISKMDFEAELISPTELRIIHLQVSNFLESLGG